MPASIHHLLAFVRPHRLPVVELLDRSPTHGLSWTDAFLAVGIGTLLVGAVAVFVWLGNAAHRERTRPHETAYLRLSRASRLSPSERRLIEAAAQRSRVDRLAILVAPSAFDRATALANIPLAECNLLRARLFGGRTR